MSKKAINVAEELAKFRNIKFNDEDHTYVMNGKKLISGTSFVGLFKEKFDSAKEAEKYAKKHKKNVEEVIAEWDFKRDYSAIKGTYLHAFAENYWGNKVFPHDPALSVNRFGEDVVVEDLDKCKEMFKQFYEDASPTLCPIALELVVGLEDDGIAGMIDKLMWNSKAQEIQIWDYKTNKEINMSSKFRKKMKFPIQWLDECEYVAYSLQLNLYKYIIEKATNLKVGDLYLIWITEKNDKYQLFKCMDVQDEIKLMVEHYKKEYGADR